MSPPGKVSSGMPVSPPGKDEETTRNSLRNFRAAAERVAAKHPDLKDALHVIVDKYEAQVAPFNIARAEAWETSKPNRHLYFQRINELKDHFTDKIRGEIVTEFPGGVGERAWTELAKEIQPKSILAPLMSPFVNDEGSMRWGGVLGALAGGGAALFMTRKIQSFWTWALGIVVGVGLGAFGGNLIGGLFTKSSKPTPAPASGSDGSRELTKLEGGTDGTRNLEGSGDISRFNVKREDVGTFPSQFFPTENNSDKNQDVDRGSLIG